MGKKRNRQQDVSEENAGESTESCEETSTGLIHFHYLHQMQDAIMLCSS